MSPYHRGPTGAGVLALAVVAVLVAFLLQLGAVSGSGQRVQSPACAELARLERRGVHAGASWRRVDRACRQGASGSR